MVIKNDSIYLTTIQPDQLACVTFALHSSDEFSVVVFLSLLLACKLNV